MSDWLPSKRVEQLAMARNWVKAFGENRTRWEIPQEEVGKLTVLVENTDEALRRVQSADRTKRCTALCTEAFDEIVGFMRELKRRRLTSPPLTFADFSLLGLRPRDTILTPVPVPQGQATAVISYYGPHLLRFSIKAMEGTLFERGRRYGFRIHYGILQAGATEGSGNGYLAKPPKTGDDLPLSKFTRRRSTMIDFSAADSGKTVYFCICLENPKGDRGPWGPIITAIIP